MNIFVLFGITGDLAKKKVIPALVELEKRSGSTMGDQIAIGIGRKPQPPSEFGMLRSNMYLVGELNKVLTYKRLKKEIYAIVKNVAKNSAKAAGSKRRHAPIHIIAYSSLPPHMHVEVAELFAKWSLDEAMNAKFGVQFKFLFEKPIGTDLASATRDIESLKKAVPAYFVDHYLCKEPLMVLRSAVATNPALFSDSIGGAGVSVIESMMYENLDVRDRGAFYDAVGSLNDTGQNHIIQMLAEGIRLREQILLWKTVSEGQMTPAQAIKRLKTKAQIMSELKIINDPIFGQYKGYAETEGVRPGSQTDTFFRVEALYSTGASSGIKGDVKNEIKCVLTGGKKLGISKSGILLKNKKHGNEIFIDMSSGKKDPYVSVFEQAVLGNTEAFAQESEILAGWKFAKRAKQIKTRKNIVYESLHDIIQ